MPTTDRPARPSARALLRIAEFLGKCPGWADAESVGPWLAAQAEPRRVHLSDAVEPDEMAEAAAVLRDAWVSSGAAGSEQAARLERVAEMLDGQLPGPVEEAAVRALVETGVYDEVDGGGDAASIIAEHIRRLPVRLDDESVDETSNAAADIAAAFHEAYERLAPAHGYETRRESAVPWLDVSEQNRRLMIAVVDDLAARQIIRAGNPPGSCRGPDGSDLCARERYHAGPCDPAERPS